MGEVGQVLDAILNLSTVSCRWVHPVPQHQTPIVMKPGPSLLSGN